MNARLWVHPAPDPRVRTEIVLASDGGLYLAFPDVPTNDILQRPVFVGYALDPLEVWLLGVKNLVRWSLTEMLAMGSDGRVYVNAHAMRYTAGRSKFRGYKASNVEVAGIVEQLHVTAFNFAVAVRKQRG